MENAMMDVESAHGTVYAPLTNVDLRSFAWDGITATVNDRQTKSTKSILSDVHGYVKAGQVMALMGPSGSGKTTLLDILASRASSLHANVDGTIFINGVEADAKAVRSNSAYVEQEDALIGSLTVRETLSFAARLSLPSSVSKKERLERVQALLSAFGLQGQSESLIGTPIRKGISGGQKRRVSVASQLITAPRILFLDEATSGLDSTATFEVISFIKNIAEQHNLIVIASIHQPSTKVFSLFDRVLLLSQGCVAYEGPVSQVRPHFDVCGIPIPLYTNPAEFLIDIANTDFDLDGKEKMQQLAVLQSAWRTTRLAGNKTLELVQEMSTSSRMSSTTANPTTEKANPFSVVVALVHRSFIKSFRDVLAYGIRVAMYMGLAIMMGTVWLRLGTEQSNIQPFINAIFFGGAFMSFMMVAGIPAYLEDRAVFIRERSDCLYGATAFTLANFITGIPYLFLITVLFSVITYWLSNFRPSATGFFTWIMWLFLDLVAAESLVILISSLVPIFVVALAATAFANGLWMCTSGFLVPPETLNVFWRYVFHYIDYQSYVFQGLMINELTERSYSCEKLESGGCHCIYQSDLADKCLIPGTSVLQAYGYRPGNEGKWVGIMIAIIVVYRFLGWLVLSLKKR